MAKYNILREDDELAKKPEEKAREEDTQEQRNNEDETAEFSPGQDSSVQRTPGEEFFTDDIFSAIDTDKSEPEPTTEPKDDIEIQTEDDVIPEMDFPSEEEPEKFDIPEEAAPQPEFTPAPESTDRPVYDYEDDYKQEGINYKPILIGVGIVAAINDNCPMLSADGSAIVFNSSSRVGSSTLILAESSTLTIYFNRSRGV